MNSKKVLTVQDISCFGQCSLTVALPIISACGIETAIIPSAVLSNHTAFKEFTFRDLTDEIPKIKKAFVRQDIKFSAIYTGYLGNAAQVGFVKDIMKNCLSDWALKIVDPAMADGGKLYTGFDESYVKEMKKLCKTADIILPNVTEAALLTSTEYKADIDKPYIEKLIDKLSKICTGKIVLTGVGFNKNTNGVAVYDDGNIYYYEHKKVGVGSHGTGDVYAAAFVGALMNNNSVFSSAKIAADYTVICIENTPEEHWYGVCFEDKLKELINMIK